MSSVGVGAATRTGARQSCWSGGATAIAPGESQQRQQFGGKQPAGRQTATATPGVADLVGEYRRHLFAVPVARPARQQPKSQTIEPGHASRSPGCRASSAGPSSPRAPGAPPRGGRLRARAADPVVSASRVVTSPGVRDSTSTISRSSSSRLMAAYSVLAVSSTSARSCARGCPG